MSDSDSDSDLSLSPNFFIRIGLRLRVFGQRLGLKSHHSQTPMLDRQPLVFQSDVKIKNQQSDYQAVTRDINYYC